MGLTDWILKRGAYGLSASLLILYKQATIAEIAGEHERWNFAFQNHTFLPISLTEEDLVAFHEVITDERPWNMDETDQKPANVVRRIVLIKARTSVGGALHPDHRRTIFGGIQKGIDEFKKNNPNISIE